MTGRGGGGGVWSDRSGAWRRPLHLLAEQAATLVLHLTLLGAHLLELGREGPPHGPVGPHPPAHPEPGAGAAAVAPPPLAPVVVGALLPLARPPAQVAPQVDGTGAEESQGGEAAPDHGGNHG